MPITIRLSPSRASDKTGLHGTGPQWATVPAIVMRDESGLMHTVPQCEIMFGEPDTSNTPALGRYSVEEIGYGSGCGGDIRRNTLAIAGEHEAAQQLIKRIASCLVTQQWIHRIKNPAN